MAKIKVEPFWLRDRKEREAREAAAQAVQEDISVETQVTASLASAQPVPPTTFPTHTPSQTDVASSAHTQQTPVPAIPAQSNDQTSEAPVSVKGMFVPQFSEPAPKAAPAPEVNVAEQLRLEKEKVEAELASLRAQYAEFDDYKRQKEILAELESLKGDLRGTDPEDAVRIIAAATRATDKKVEEFKKSLEAQSRKAEEEELKRQQKAQIDARYKLEADIKKAVPDLEYIWDSEEWKRHVEKPLHPDDLNLKLRHLIANAINEGNAPLIIKELRSFKGNTQGLDQLASVDTSAGPVAVAPPVEEETRELTPEELEELNHARKTGRISREEFSTRLEKHKAARKAARQK